MPGSDKAIRRLIFVASFFLVCSFAVSLIQAQSLQKPHSIPPQLYPKSSSTAIASNVIPNTYLVRVSSSWIKSVSLEPSLANLSSQLKCQDESFGLYRYVGNESVLLELKAKANLAGIPFTYQPEHYIQRRSLKPNDPLLPQQRYLDVIQMPLAWEQGMAGVNRYGDTLVVAVVDDGMDTSHPDLRENIWVNRKEIPWNGKDDDNNGYTDDYWGWNGGDSTPIIFNSESIFYGHGTSVAGVLGARGNNGIGVSGVIWQVKMMPLLCYSTKGADGEVGVVRSMLYAYRQKKRWINSQGKEGANVVALNMSVGLDKAFANEAPIWCAMFDSLASVGIISAGATTNSNIDVEKEGDIPSLCLSDGLIVTSSTGLNKQFDKAGYGTTSVDIAAPGGDVYTAIPRQINPASPYKGEQGTSFAAPMIAGTVAWLNSVVCKYYLDLMSVNTDSAIGLMRNWILTSVEPNKSLDTVCVTSGVLQCFNAWKKMDAWCMLHEPTYGADDIVSAKPILFPNPSVDQSFELAFPMSMPLTVSIYDASGRVVWTGVANTNEKIEMNRKLASGLYYVDAKVGGNSTRITWIVN
ncbi:MAG: hypothetical protein RL041_1478 [Bacteroidota bacterium]